MARRLASFVPAIEGMRRASAESVLIGLAGQGALVISGVLLARSLGPQDRGYVALLMLWPIVIAKVGELGIPNAAAYYIAREQPSFRHIAGLVRRLALRQIPLLVICHGLVLTAFLVGKSSDVVHGGLLTLVGVPAYVLTDYGFAMLQGQQRFRALNLLRMVNPALLSTFLVVLVAARRASLVSALSVSMVAVCISATAFLLVAMRFYVAQDPLRSNISIRDLLRFGLHGLLGSLYPVETFRIDQIAVGLLLSPAALGLYVVGIAFTNLPTLISQSLGNIAYPGVAAELARDQRRQILWQFFWLFASTSIAIVVVLELLVAQLIPWFFGTQFIQSIGIARIALLGALVLSARRILAETLRGAGHPAAGTLAEGVLLAVLIPAMLLGGRYWGAEGVAAAVAVAGAASLLVLIAFEASVMRSPEEPGRVDIPS